MLEKVALITLTAIVLVGAQTAHARESVDRTGSRLGSDVTNRMVVRFAEPEEITRVVRLLEQDRAADAIALAQEYLNSLDSATFFGNSNGSRERYSGLNALCAALTKAGSVDEAVAACTEAIALFPTLWTAHSNRGTAHFAAQNFDRALADYRAALQVAPRSNNVVTVIEHNIRLAEQRLAVQSR